MIKTLKTTTLACWLAGCLCLTTTGTTAAQASAQDSVQEAAQTTTPTDSGDAPMAQELTDKQIEQIFNDGKPIPRFNDSFTVEELSARCQNARWAEPAPPDAISHGWYRAATTLNATKRKNARQYQDMIVLYEGAARRGHYRAMMHLIIEYSDGQKTWDDMLYKPEPEKARMWIHEGLRREWVGALEWLATALYDGSAGYRRNNDQSLAYLQLAAEKGSALAQYQLGWHYDNVLKSITRGEALYECAAAQGYISAANDKWAIIQRIYRNPEVALQNYQLAVMGGGQNGGEAAHSLYRGFASSRPGGSNAQKELNTFHDPIRAQAYKDLGAYLDDGYDSQGIERVRNRFLRFPRLNEVLPLPPAVVTEWKGIYSAMSPEDAEYYQNPPPADYYIQQIINSGYLPPKGYLQEPVPYKEK